MNQGDRGDISERLARLESRLREVEDRQAILELLNRYGLIVDSGEAGPAVALWVDGGTYTYSGGRVRAPGGMTALYDNDGWRDIVASGVSHLHSLPVISLDGDTATAVGYTYVVVPDAGRWTVARAAINTWTLARTADGWRIAERTNVAVDGSAESHATIARGA